MTILFPARVPSIRFLRFLPLVAMVTLSSQMAAGAGKPTSEGGLNQKLLVVAFDGLRYDFINEDLTPNIYHTGKAGVFAKKGMTSVFPTTTTPNFYAMSTGLYAESGGIVGNVMFDASRNYTKFDYWNFGNDSAVLEESLKEHWWHGKPLYFLNNPSLGESHLTGCMFWPTCDIEPGPGKTAPPPNRVRRWEIFGELEDWKKDFDELLSWFEGDDDRINLGYLYVGIPDEVEHYNDIFGPEVREAIRSLDTLFGYIMKSVRESRVVPDMNVVLLADHGHINIKLPDNVISVEEEYPLEKQNLTAYGGAEWSFRPADGKEKPAAFWDDLYNSLSKAKRDRNLPFSVFRRDDPALAHFHYANRPSLVGPIVAIPDPGYYLLWNQTLEEMLLRPKYHDKTAVGNHGYDNAAPELRALFVANGPAFKCQFEVTEPFLNIHLHPLFAHIIGVEPDPAANGSLDAVRHLLRPNAAQTGSHAEWPCAFASSGSSEPVPSLAKLVSVTQSTVRKSGPLIVMVFVVVIPVASFICYCLVTVITPRQPYSHNFNGKGVEGGMENGGGFGCGHGTLRKRESKPGVILKQPLLKLEKDEEDSDEL